MKLPKIREKNITVVASDGRNLSARFWPGNMASQRTVIFLSGMGAPQGYLRWFATYLAAQGWGVLTFDYRGIGSSRDELQDLAVTLDDWINLDLPAVVSEVKQQTNPQFLAVMAHSVGGQLLGQSPIRHEIDGALFISCQRGIPQLFKGRARLQIHYAYTIFPLIIHCLGYLPISKWTLPQPCPSKVLLQWMRWGRTGKFTNDKGINVEGRFADYTGPLITITIADDEDYASAASVEALASLYQGAKVQSETISPQDYGLEKIGHFGFFHRRTPHRLWSLSEEWLRQLHLEALGNADCP